MFAGATERRDPGLPSQGIPLPRSYLPDSPVLAGQDGRAGPLLPTLLLP